MEERPDCGISITKGALFSKDIKTSTVVRSKSNLNDFVIGDEKVTSKSATVDKPKSGSTVEKSASKETDAAPEEPKSTTALANPLK